MRKILLIFLSLLSLIIYSQPEAKWLFDNNGIDSSGNGHTLTLSGGASYSTTRIQGTHSALFEYGDKAQMSTALNLGDTFTVSLSFYKPPQTGTVNVLATNKYNAGSSGWGLYLDTDDKKIYFRSTNPVLNHYTTSTTYTYSSNTWTHVTLKVNKILGTASIYVDGDLKVSGNVWTNMNTNDTVCIGSYRAVSVGGPFNGYIDNVHVYKCISVSETELSNNKATSTNSLCSTSEAVDSVRISPRSLSVVIGNSNFVDGYLYPDIGNVSWTASDSSKISITPSISSGCWVVGLSPGTSYLIATSSISYMKDSILVTVRNVSSLSYDTLKINFTNALNIYPLNNWNNLTNTLDGTIHNLIKSDGLSSNITMTTLGSAWNDVNNNYSTSGAYPLPCMNGLWGVTSGTLRLIFSNLISGNYYNIRILGSRQTSEIRSTGYAIRGVSDTLLIKDNTTNYIDLYFISGGTDTLSIYNVISSYGYINTLILTTENPYDKKHLRGRTVNNYVAVIDGIRYKPNMTNIYNQYLDDQGEEVLPPDPTLKDESLATLNDITLYYNNDFESSAYGYYTQSAWRNEFNNTIYDGQFVRNQTTIIDAPAGRTGKVINFNFPAHSVGCCDDPNNPGSSYPPIINGGTVAYFNIEPRDEITMQYYMRWSPLGYGWSQNTVGGGGKLLSFQLGNWESGSIIGTTVATCGVMFNNAGIPQFYIYWPDSPYPDYDWGVNINWGYPMSVYQGQSGNWLHDGDPDNYTQLYVNYTSGTYPSMTDGQWHNLAVRCVANTITNGTPNYDGILEGFWDGQLVIQVGGIKFRDVSTLKINTVRLTTFFGGQREYAGDTRRENTYEMNQQVDNWRFYEYKENVNVPRGNTFSSPTRTLKLF